MNIVMLTKFLDSGVVRIKKLNGFNSGNQVSKSEMEMMRIMERLKEADIEIQWRDNEVQQLNERIRCMEDRSGRVDDKLSCLQAEKINLQAENRALLEQVRLHVDLISLFFFDMLTRFCRTEICWLLLTTLNTWCVSFLGIKK